MVIINKHLRCFLSVMLLCSSIIPHIAASGSDLSATPAAAQATSTIWSSITPGLMGFTALIAAGATAFVWDQFKATKDVLLAEVRKKGSEYAVEYLGGPLKKYGVEAIPSYIQRTEAFLHNTYYRMSENNQRFFAALPFMGVGSLCAGLGALCAANSGLSPVLRYSLAGVFAIGSLVNTYKAGAAYKKTHCVHADTQQALAMTVQGQLFDQIVKSLSSPCDQATFALDVNHSMYITGSLDENARESFMRSLAARVHMNLFIVDMQELIDTPALLETVVARAKLSTRTGKGTGTIVCIKHFGLLTNQKLAKQLSETISTETNTTWAHLREIAISNWVTNHSNSTPETEAWLKSIADTAKQIPIPSMLFVASINDPGSFSDVFRDHRQFNTGLDIACPDSGSPQAFTCQQVGRALNFDSWADCINVMNEVYAERRYYMNDFSELRAERERIHAQQLRLASSTSNLQTIAGGYPAEIDVIAHTIATCQREHQQPTVKGVLLWGEPGCGKTYLAKALAGTLRAPFFTAQVADILSAGDGASEKLTTLFAQAQAKAMMQDSGGISILFIDECDQLLQPTSTAPDYIAPIAYTLRSLLSGFDKDYDRVVLVVATNKSPEALDQALTRSRRFDYKINITYPTQAARAQIITYHAEQKKLALTANFIDYLAENTPKCAASDMAMLVDKAMATASARGIDIKEALVQELMHMRGISQRPPMGVGGKTIGQDMKQRSSDRDMRDIVSTVVDTASTPIGAISRGMLNTAQTMVAASTPR